MGALPSDYAASRPHRGSGEHTGRPAVNRAVNGDLPEPAASVEVGLFREAVRRGLKVELTYKDGQGTASHRLLWPIGLAFMEESRFVIAYCELRCAFRHFRLDRIGWAQLSEPCPERRVVLLRRWREQLAAEATAADTRRQEPAL